MRDKRHNPIRSSRTFLLSELLGLFITAPLLATVAHVSRWQIFLSLWVVAAYAAIHMMGMPGFSWRDAWNGRGWERPHKRNALLRFFLLSPLPLAFAWWLDPDRLFGFPLQRPLLWAAVMFVYPLLSVVLQEFVYRTFFFERYKPLFSNSAAMILASAFCFGFVHIMFHNWIAPVFSGIGGLLFSVSYARHKSLKLVSIEHAAYGCYVFTIGLGWYFYNTG